MKPTYEITDKLLDNKNSFNNEFYNRFDLRADNQPLKLNQDVSKDYLFPTLYGDVTCSIGIFMADYDKVQSILPHPSVKPVKMTRGKALVLFSSYIYGNVLGVAPYNEIAMTVPIMVDPKVSPPILPIITNWFENFGYYVFSMPVTSLENQIRGEKLWGLPKVVQSIEITESATDITTVACEEESGEPYFTMRVPKSGKPTTFDEKGNLYSRLGDEFIQSTTCFKGDFNVEKHMGMLFSSKEPTGKPFIEFGDSPSGQFLKNLELEAHPFQTRFAKNMSSCFDLPNTNYQSPISFKG